VFDELYGDTQFRCEMKLPPPKHAPTPESLENGGSGTFDLDQVPIQDGLQYQVEMCVLNKLSNLYSEAGKWSKCAETEKRASVLSAAIFGKNDARTVEMEQRLEKYLRKVYLFIYL